MNNKVQSYFTEEWFLKIDSRLKELYKETKRINQLNSAATLLMSREILQSLNTKSLPVGPNLYYFRKSIITKFHEKVITDINPNVSLATEIYRSGNLECLVTEYHIRIYNCLKIVLKYIGDSM